MFSVVRPPPFCVGVRRRPPADAGVQRSKEGPTRLGLTRCPDTRRLPQRGHTLVVKRGFGFYDLVPPATKNCNYDGHGIPGFLLLRPVLFHRDTVVTRPWLSSRTSAADIASLSTSTCRNA